MHVYFGTTFHRHFQLQFSYEQTKNENLSIIKIKSRFIFEQKTQFRQHRSFHLPVLLLEYYFIEKRKLNLFKKKDKTRKKPNELRLVLTRLVLRASFDFLESADFDVRERHVLVNDEDLVDPRVNVSYRFHCHYVAAFF